MNNAGMLERGFSVAETDIDTWCRTWDVNVKVSHLSDKNNSKGCYIPSRYFLSQSSLEGKTIINTTSVGALLHTPGLSGYQSAKTAVIR